MTPKRRLGLVGLIGLVLIFILNVQQPLKAEGSTLGSGSILLAQIKITSSNGQFIALYNNTASSIDMSTIQLAYYNYYDLASSKLTSSRFIALAGTLPPHGYYMVSDGAMLVCYKMIVNAVSLGFSTTAGMVQVVQGGPGNVLDSVAWSKTKVTGGNVQTLPTDVNSFLQRAWLDGMTRGPGDPWSQPVAPSGPDGCDLLSRTMPIVPEATNTTPQTVKMVTVPQENAVANNSGLVAPELTELFPNPAAPQSDDIDEFIELYNPNNDVYNLAGYRLEAGTSYSRGYTFQEGTLQPKSHTAFKITDTNLQLSNGEGQVRLLSPDSTTISETPGYEDAPEGESWSLVMDSWQWSMSPTPNAANMSSTESGDSDKTADTSKPKVASTKKSKGKVAGASTAVPSSNDTKELEDAAPLHPLVLAGVGLSAVAYALYEYRKDMANSFFKVRRYLRRWRAARTRVQGR
jgi:hypothetical protein